MFSSEKWSESATLNRTRYFSPEPLMLCFPGWKPTAPFQLSEKQKSHTKKNNRRFQRQLSHLRRFSTGGNFSGLVGTERWGSSCTQWGFHYCHGGPPTLTWNWLQPRNGWENSEGRCYYYFRFNSLLFSSVILHFLFWPTVCQLFRLKECKQGRELKYSHGSLYQKTPS